jgi:hypothetical protein
VHKCWTTFEYLFDYKYSTSDHPDGDDPQA